jgi:ATP/maltotriose-dependent transcriptional regulator MalT
MYEELGDTARFWAITEENLADARAHGHKRIEARALSAFAERAAHEGRHDEAESFSRQALRIDRELGNLPFQTVDLVRHTYLLTQQGKPTVAAMLLSAATALRGEIGLRSSRG